MVGAVLAVVVGLLAAWAALVLLLWLLRPRDVALSELVAFVPDLVRLVRALLRDPTADGRARFALGVLLVWLISPIDLIPEFIPVLGPLDDVVVAVLVLRYVRRRVGVEALLSRWPGSEAGERLLMHVIGAT